MRAIRFRAWNKLLKVMIYPGDPTMPDLTATGLPVNHFTRGDLSERYELMQFTGLRDKFGKEIYERDIVKVIYSTKNDDMDEESLIHKVIWGDDYPAFDLEPIISDESNSLQYASIKYELEVIGNVHANPELLESNERRTSAVWRRDKGHPG